MDVPDGGNQGFSKRRQNAKLEPTTGLARNNLGFGDLWNRARPHRHKGLPSLSCRPRWGRFFEGND
jgi:hypothetical protein